MIDETSIRKALSIRALEERLLTLFAQGRVNGTVHTCVGQEWTGVALARCLAKGDIIISNHRGHGHFLAWTGDVDGLIAEVMGRASGVCGGVGGSQHLYAEGFYSNGIQGGMTPVAAGLGLGHVLDGKPHVVVVFVGDGTLGEGQLYESLNIISAWKLPVVVVVENNQYAQSTRTTTTTAGSVVGRAAAFGLRYHAADTWHVQQLFNVVEQAVQETRQTRTPCLIEIQTYRLNAHSKGDDNRAKAELDAYREKDVLHRLLEGTDAQPACVAWMAEARETVEEAIRRADASPLSTFTPEKPIEVSAVSWRAATVEAGRCADQIYQAFKEAMAADGRITLIGEDIEGPYGGAFKVTRDLSTLYPGRVRNTPIAEGLIVGLSTGLALSGRVAVAEIMFGDFLTLTLDQLLQHACKFREMYNGQVSVPLVVRTPMGGRRGYGPTHSQSIEKFFLGVPGLTVLALNHRVSPLYVYAHLLKTVTSPTLVIENKILYTRFQPSEVQVGFETLVSNEPYPCFRLVPRGIDPQVTIVCYGGMLEEAEAAVETLFEEHDIVCELICPTQICPLNLEPVEQSVRVSHRLVIAEEGCAIASFGSELVACLVEKGVDVREVRRLGYQGIIPACFQREVDLLPGRQHIVQAVKEMGL